MKHTILAGILTVFLLPMSISSCQEKTPGEEIKEAAEEVGDEVREGVEETGDAIKDATDQ